MLGSVVGYFFSVITVLATVMTFMTLLIGVFDNSMFEKLRHYPRPIIERTVTPAPPDQDPHHVPNPEPHHTLLALGTNTTAPKHLSARDKNTKHSRAASSAIADVENRNPERDIGPERLAQLREPKALAHQRQNYEGHGIAAALGRVGGLAVYALDSVLTALTPELRPDGGADNQSAAPASQQKPQPGSTPLPQSILAAKPLGPASQFQPPSSNQVRGNQPPGNQQQVATPAQQQTALQASATPAPHAAIANDDDRPAASRRVRHPRKQATFTLNAPRYRERTMCRATGPTSMVHGQAVRRSLASIILTANRGSGRTRAISAARG